LMILSSLSSKAFLMLWLEEDLEQTDPVPHLTPLTFHLHKYCLTVQLNYFLFFFDVFAFALLLEKGDMSVLDLLVLKLMLLN